MSDATITQVRQPDWGTVLRRYFVFSAAGHLAWETAHIPLHTIRVEGTRGEIGYAILQSTGGDLLIAMSTMLLALFVAGRAAWPLEHRQSVLAVAVGLGVAYTVFSEWLDIVVRAAWTYRDIMPVVPILDAGLAAQLQWIVVPTAAYVAAVRPTLTEPHRMEPCL